MSVPCPSAEQVANRFLNRFGFEGQVEIMPAILSQQEEPFDEAGTSVFSAIEDSAYAFLRRFISKRKRLTLRDLVCRSGYQNYDDLCGVESQLKDSTMSSPAAKSHFDTLLRVAVDHAKLTRDRTGREIPGFHERVDFFAEVALLMTSSLLVIHSICHEGVDPSKLLPANTESKPTATSAPFDHILRVDIDWAKIDHIAAAVKENLGSFSPERTVEERKASLEALGAGKLLMDEATFRTFADTFRPLFMPSDRDKPRLEESFKALGMSEVVDFMGLTLPRLEGRMTGASSSSEAGEDTEMTDV